jgi:EAL domain-containing protein (putative c-di-GMP-specific phosphodiesterase class I)/GGDEF domain-containing protein
MEPETGAGRDPISGAPNRQRFLDDHHAAPARPMAIALVTLADARAFNEILRALGHARSEAFIRAGAARLAETLGPGVTVYHVSVLSFVCVLPLPERGERPPVVGRILRGFATPLLCDDIPIDTRIGLGLAPLSDAPGRRAEDLRAALAAAQDSRARPEGWAWYDPRSDVAHRRAFGLLTDLKAALAADDQLHLAFQPKVRLATGEATGVEALVRWRHPTLGPVSPGEFVPLAEATALLTPLTRWVISAALAQMSGWDRAGLRLDVAINVSPKNLEEPDFVEYLLFACAAAGVDRRRVELEVTEGVNAAQGPLILDRLAALRRLGFSIAIDDFGSGYSNMSYLSRLSAQTLKIDQSLVRGVAPKGQAGRLLAGVVAMGRDLGYRVVAEGVETEAERAMLAAWGCDYGQGYLFAKPMSGADLVAWVRARAPEAARRRA